MHKRLPLMAAFIAGMLIFAPSALAGDKNETENQTNSQTQEQTQNPKDQKHIVKAGESLSTIATEYNLESWLPIWNANEQIEHPDLIFPGQELLIPAEETAERPLPAAPVATTPNPVPQRAAAVPAQRVATPAPTGDIFARIRQRESGGRYDANTGNGYYGAYQFDLPTWRSNGGIGYPHQASPEEQDMRARMLYERRGCNPWPNTCH